jgi:hypothetical protein
MYVKISTGVVPSIETVFAAQITMVGEFNCNIWHIGLLLNAIFDKVELMIVGQ